MAIIGITTNRENPPYTIAQFLVWQPQFTAFMATEKGQVTFNELYDVANHKIFKSIFGSDWSLAMSLCIAHYLTLIANNLQAPAGDTLETIAGGGALKGVVSSASVGGFSKTIDTKLTISEDKEALFWNQTSYGAELWALLCTKPVPSIMVVTPGPVPGAN